MTRVKICGIRSIGDARLAVDLGAAALGFIFWPRSPRYIAPDRAGLIIAELPSDITTVAVFVNESIEDVRRAVESSGVNAIQLYGDETPAYADALALPPFRAVTIETADVVCPAWPPGTTHSHRSPFRIWP